MKIQTLFHKDGTSFITKATKKTILKMLYSGFAVDIIHKGEWARVERIKGAK